MEDYLDKVKAELKNMPISRMRVLAAECEVSIEWVKRVKYGRITDPSISRVTRVYNNLFGKK